MLELMNIMMFSLFSYGFYYDFGCFVVFSQRLTAEQSMEHPWMRPSTVHSDQELSKSKLKRYVIKKRWIKAVNTIIALQRMGAKIDARLI